jgi:tetratricopeptide (TPR) repeat protein
MAPPNPATTAIQAGIAQLSAGNLLGAEESFRMALALEPANFNAVEGIVSALIAQGRSVAARLFLNQHRPALWDEHPAAALDFALALDRTGDWRNAQKAYSMVIALDPKNVTALNNLAYLLAQHDGDLDDALMYAERAARLGPDRAEAQDTLGYIHIRRGELDAALQVFDRLLENTPAHAEALALQLAANGRADAVRTKLAAALAANPSPEARQAIQDLLNKLR